jgi:hypothetical protein
MTNEILREIQSSPTDEGPVWFVANYATLCLRLVVRIEELTLGTKVWQNVVN